MIVSSEGGIRMTDWTDVKAILYNWYPRQIGNIALAEVLSGQTNPSGKLPMTIEKEVKDFPAYGYRPADAKFLCEHPSYFDMDAPKAVIDRWSFDTSIQEAPDQLYDVNYDEGVLVGYRWYDTKNIEPLFPFGFGLSYSSFIISDAQLSSSKITKEETIKVSVKLSNTGTQAGATVAQLYVSEKKPTDIRPIKELKAFKKVMLEAGESKVIDLYLDKAAFAFWNSETKSWTVNSGEFEIMIGQSSRDINEVLSLEVM